MEHLPVHLPHEAKIDGPMQYRWMYPFERYLRKLKNNVKNKARVEGSIANTYLVEETSTFISFYFEDHVSTKITRPPRNDDGIFEDDVDDRVPFVFKKSGKPFGTTRKRFLDQKEYNAARIYVLLNCNEIAEYVNIFMDNAKHIQPSITDARLNEKVEMEFADWFHSYVEIESALDEVRTSTQSEPDEDHVYAIVVQQKKNKYFGTSCFGKATQKAGSS